MNIIDISSKYSFPLVIGCSIFGILWGVINVFFVRFNSHFQYKVRTYSALSDGYSLALTYSNSRNFLRYLVTHSHMMQCHLKSRVDISLHLTV